MLQACKAKVTTDSAARMTLGFLALDRLDMHSRRRNVQEARVARERDMKRGGQILSGSFGSSVAMWSTTNGKQGQQGLSEAHKLGLEAEVVRRRRSTS